MTTSMDKSAIIFTGHALFQMKERKITRARVADCIVKPDKVVAESFNRYQALKLFKRNEKKYLFVVVYDQENGEIEVVTSFVTSKLKNIYETALR